MKNEKICWIYYPVIILFTHAHQKSQSYDVRSWDTEWDRQKILSFWAIFCPFTSPLPPNDPEYQNFEKKCLEILSFYTYMCIINEDHIYSSWNIRCDRQRNIWHFGPFFAFQPLDNLENQDFDIEKTPGDIIILHICTIIHNHMIYGSWDMECNGQNFLSFWTIFCLFTPLTAQKIKILKNEKISWRYHHFTQLYQKLWSDDVQFLRYGARQMDGQMEKVTYRGRCPT